MGCGGSFVRVGANIFDAKQPSPATLPTKDTSHGLVLVELDPASSPNQTASFPLPAGWRVVCKLSPSEARSRWGALPRPSAVSKVSASDQPVPRTLLDMKSVVPGFSGPISLPLQLLPQWTDPEIGEIYLGRYAVQECATETLASCRCGVSDKQFQVYDRQRKCKCCLRVCELKRDSNVETLIKRFQVESFDPDDRWCFRLRDIVMVLPSHIAMIEDVPACSLWEKFGCVNSKFELCGLVKVVAIPILAGLSHLHSVGWVHSGVCPDTICLSSDGTWRLTNVGSSKRVDNLINGSSHCMSNISPEALLGASVTEKADIWQLAASFCEAITRVRAVQQVLNSADKGIAEKLCSLIDFCGPLPANLVAGYPNRDLHFTPEGQILRAVSPDTSETAFLEVIEPVAAARCMLDGTPRPHLLVQALEGVDASLGILEFVGLLLHPDPDKRPSAANAACHPFLQQKLKVSTETGNPAGLSESAQQKYGAVSKVNSDQARGYLSRTMEQQEGKEVCTYRRGSMDPAGNSADALCNAPAFQDQVACKNGNADKDEMSVRGPVVVERRVTIPDIYQGSQQSMNRTCTHFVHPHELPPPSDDTDNDNDDDNEASGFSSSDEEEKTLLRSPSCRRESVLTERRFLSRKNTGFIHAADLAFSDDDDNECNDDIDECNSDDDDDDGSECFNIHKGK